MCTDSFAPVFSINNCAYKYFFLFGEVTLNYSVLNSVLTSQKFVDNPVIYNICLILKKVYTLPGFIPPDLEQGLLFIFEKYLLQLYNPTPSPNTGGRFDFPGIYPLLCVWVGRPSLVWPLLLPASTYLGYLVSPVVWLMLCKGLLSLLSSPEAFLTTNRGAVLLSQEVERLIRIRYFGCEDDTAEQ